MQPQTDGDFKKLFTELIKKQMVVLGPDITMAKVKNVPGLVVDEKTGEVILIEGDHQAMLQDLINQFVELSGLIVKKTMESILSNYPGLMTMAANGIVGAAPVASSPSTGSGHNSLVNSGQVSSVGLGQAPVENNSFLQTPSPALNVASAGLGQASPAQDPISIPQVSSYSPGASSEESLPEDQIDALNKIFQSVAVDQDGVQENQNGQGSVQPVNPSRNQNNQGV